MEATNYRFIPPIESQQLQADLLAVRLHAVLDLVNEPELYGIPMTTPVKEGNRPGLYPPEDEVALPTVGYSFKPGQVELERGNDSTCSIRLSMAGEKIGRPVNDDTHFGDPDNIDGNGWDALLVKIDPASSTPCTLWGVTEGLEPVVLHVQYPKDPWFLAKVCLTHVEKKMKARLTVPQQVGSVGLGSS